MYPTLGDFGRPGQQQQQMNSNMQPGTYASPWMGPPNGPSNGPVPAPPPPVLPQHSSYNYPTLRVQIADRLRTTPPVMVHRGSSDIPGTSFNFTFEYEHQLQQRLQSARQSSGQSLGGDPLESTMKDLASTDYTREEASFALTALTGTKPDADKVKEYCKNFRDLRSMGFDAATVTGALLLHKQDLSAATDACLNSQ